MKPRRPWHLFAGMAILVITALLTWAASTLRTPAHGLAELGASSPALPASYRRLSWPELVPADWNPLKRFQTPDALALSEGDPRERALIEEMRDLWDNAPTVTALDGTKVRLSGYIVPLDASGAHLREFLLVPYFGACIHTPPPPANQIVHVRLRESAPWRTMDTVQVSGTLHARRHSTVAGMSGYTLDADSTRAFSSAFSSSSAAASTPAGGSSKPQP